MPLDKEKIESLQWAIKTGDTDRVKEIVESQKDLNVNAKYGKLDRTLLHMAADFNQAAVITYLLSKKANVAQRDANEISDMGIKGMTPLDAAVSEGNVEATQTLLKGGAKPDAGTIKLLELIESSEKKDAIAKLLPKK